MYLHVCTPFCPKGQATTQGSGGDESSPLEPWFKFPGWGRDAFKLCEKMDMRGSRGGTGGSDTLKSHKNIGFLSNTGPDTL